jgi:hypothetical protein
MQRSINRLKERLERKQSQVGARVQRTRASSRMGGNALHAHTCAQHPTRASGHRAKARLVHLPCWLAATDNNTSPTPQQLLESPT